MFIPPAASRGPRDLAEVAPVLALAERLGERDEVRGRDPAEPERHLLQAADLEALPLLDDGDEVRRLEQRFVGPGVEPRVPAREHVNLEPSALEVGPVDVGDLELAARAGLETP